MTGEMLDIEKTNRKKRQTTFPRDELSPSEERSPKLKSSRCSNAADFQLEGSSARGRVTDCTGVQFWSSSSWCFWHLQLQACHDSVHHSEDTRNIPSLGKSCLRDIKRLERPPWFPGCHRTGAGSTLELFRGGFYRVKQKESSPLLNIHRVHLLGMTEIPQCNLTETSKKGGMWRFFWRLYPKGRPENNLGQSNGDHRWVLPPGASCYLGKPIAY